MIPLLNRGKRSTQYISRSSVIIASLNILEGADLASPSSPKARQPFVPHIYTSFSTRETGGVFNWWESGRQFHLYHDSEDFRDP